MTTFENILTETRGRVAVITLNRPAALNALNDALMREVVASVEQFDADRGIGAIVITGSERAFAAGADIKEMSSKSYQEMLLSDWFGAWDRLASVRTPLIAAVSGYALGGGCELAMMCDLMFASPSAKFGQPEITLGVIPGMGGTQRLTRAIGKAKAMDLILTGRTIDAEEAERSGLVSRILRSDDFLGEVMEIATALSERSLPAVYAAKESVNRAFESTLAEGIRFERRTFFATFALDDQSEGMAAFMEKRPAEFAHH